MKRPFGILTGLVLVLALVTVTGICAADENTTVTATETVTETVTATPTETVTETVTATATQTTIADNSDDNADDGDTGDGSFGPGNPLYGLKIGLENLDETFTFNETDKLNKQMNHARLRLAEVRHELLLNNTVTADEALALYQDKLNATRLYLDIIENASNETGILHAQEMVTKHQMELERLRLANPNSTGLARAYNNSLALEQKFENKTKSRIERIVEKNNRTVLKAVRLNARIQERTENHGQNQTVEVQQTEKVRYAGGTGNAAGNTSATGNKDVRDNLNKGNQNDNRNDTRNDNNNDNRNDNSNDTRNDNGNTNGRGRNK